MTQSLGILEFSSLRGFEKAEAISFIKPFYQDFLLSFELDCFGRFVPSQ
ncbi:hypothetical protein [Campylobacter sp.]|nr:hypothetical protein [Campylobacter sp.]